MQNKGEKINEVASSLDIAISKSRYLQFIYLHMRNYRNLNESTIGFRLSKHERSRGERRHSRLNLGSPVIDATGTGTDFGF